MEDIYVLLLHPCEAHLPTFMLVQNDGVVMEMEHTRARLPIPEAGGICRLLCRETHLIRPM